MYEFLVHEDFMNAAMSKEIPNNEPKADNSCDMPVLFGGSKL